MGGKKKMARMGHNKMRKKRMHGRKEQKYCEKGAEEEKD